MPYRSSLLNSGKNSISDASHGLELLLDGTVAAVLQRRPALKHDRVRQGLNLAWVNALLKEVELLVIIEVWVTLLQH